MQNLTGCTDDVVPELNAVTLKCLPIIFQNIVTWLFILVGVAAIILIAYSGVKFILSGGDSKQVEGARKTFTYAIAGLVVVLLAYTVIRVISHVTGVVCFQDFLNFTPCQVK